MSSPLQDVPQEGCDNSGGTYPIVRLNAAALSDPTLSDPDSFFTSVSLPTLDYTTTTGLVDSGSSHCFIDTDFINNNNVPTYDIPHLALRLLDGSVNTLITHAADIPIRLSTGDIITLTFFVTKLDPVCALVFGHNWLHKYNPSIDWLASQILFFRNKPQKLSAL